MLPLSPPGPGFSAGRPGHTLSINPCVSLEHRYFQCPLLILAVGPGGDRGTGPPELLMALAMDQSVLAARDLGGCASSGLALPPRPLCIPWGPVPHGLVPVALLRQ